MAIISVGSIVHIHSSPLESNLNEEIIRTLKHSMSLLQEKPPKITVFKLVFPKQESENINLSEVPPPILHDLKCLKIPHHVFECILAIRVISATTCACGISWLVTRFFYLCLEPTVFRLLNKYFGFSGRAKTKKKFCSDHC